MLMLDLDCLFLFAGINESAQMGVFQVLAAILHLGNVEMRDKDSDSSTIAVRFHIILQRCRCLRVRVSFQLSVVN